jgi:abortive infection bacteriophage resistance protein
MPDSRVLFAKPVLTLDEQISLLEGRGLTVPDRARARHYLNFIGYYRLCGYAKAFQTGNPGHAFVPGTSFEDILDLYIFDRNLRQLLSDALERIEVAIKADLSNCVALQKGPFWLLGPENFDYGRHEQVMGEIKSAIGDDPNQSQHIFIRHFYNKYSEPEYPPSWMLMETLSLGAVSRIYKITKGELRKPVADTFHLHHRILESWLHALTYTRNLCAHHNMVWCRDFTIKPKIPKTYQGSWPAASHGKLFVICGIIKHMMHVISDGSRWPERLVQLIDQRETTALASMGFPENWQTRL